MCQYTLFDVVRYIAYVALNVCVKYCRKDQSNVKGVKGTLYRFQWIKCYIKLCMSEMVFAAFTQHCIQSTDLMLKVSKILWIQWPLDPLSVLDLSLTCFDKHSIWYG